MTAVGWNAQNSEVPGMLSTYPGTKVVRMFRGSPGQTLPAWSAFGNVPDDVHIIYSWKTWPDDLAGFMTAMPTARRNRFTLTYWHEPENDTITGAQYRSDWSDILAIAGAHANRQYIKFGPIYTEFWAANNDWENTFWSADMQAHCDFIGWDIYNQVGQTPSQYPSGRFNFAIQSSAAHGKPFLVGEFGSWRTSSDTTGSGAAAWMRLMVETAAETGDCWYCCWYHNSGNDLVAENRTTERDELRELVLEFNDPGTGGGGEPPPGGGGGGPLTVVDSKFITNTSSSTSIVVPAPVGIANGDLLIAIVGLIGQVAITAPAGWTLIGTQDASSNTRSAAYWKLANNESGNYTFTIASAFKNWGWAAAIRGHDPASIIPAFASAAGVSGTSHALPSVAVPADGMLISAVSGRFPTTGVLTTWSNGTAGDIERYDGGSSNGSQDITGAVYTSPPLTAGNYGRTLTSSQSVSQLAEWSIAIAANPSAGNTGWTAGPIPI